jgi:hypothetical protein
MDSLQRAEDVAPPYPEDMLLCGGIRVRAAGGGGARSQIVLNYGVLAPLCDPILDRGPIYRATHQVAALHEAIEGYTDIQFANIAPAPTGSS